MERMIIISEDEFKALNDKLDFLIATMSNGTDDIMTASEVAELLGLNVQVVYKKAREGELPSWRSGSIVRFVRSEIIKTMKGQNDEETEKMVEC